MATGYFIKTAALLDSQVGNTPAVAPFPLAGTPGGWFFVGQLLSPTITVEGLEPGGVVSITVLNGYNPLLSDTDINAVAPPSDMFGSPHITLGNCTEDIGGGLGGAFTWVRASKVAGVSPTPTTVMMQSQQAK